MTGYDVYKTYCAMRAHFTTKQYDIFKYKGRINASRVKYEARKDRYRMEKMAKNMKDQEIIDFYVANFTTTTGYTGLWDDQSDRRYKEWLGRRQSLSYEFKKEVSELFYDAKDSGLCYNDVFGGNESQHPLVFVSMLAKSISLDTFVILDRINNFSKDISADIVTEDGLLIAEKYSPFLKVDTNTYREITHQLRENIFE